MHKWSDFQSLIQVSIALNVAYFSISQLVDTMVAREELNHVQLTESINDIRRSSSSQTDDELNDLRSEVSDLRDSLSDIIIHDRIIISVLGKFSVTLFFVGMALLIKSSFNPDQRITVLYSILCAALSLPVTLGVFLVGIINSLRYRTAIGKRRSIDDRIQAVNERRP